MTARAHQIYMKDHAWDYIDKLQSVNPKKGRGAIMEEIILADKKRKEREEKRLIRQTESNPAA